MVMKMPADVNDTNAALQRIRVRPAKCSCAKQYASAKYVNAAAPRQPSESRPTARRTDPYVRIQYASKRLMTGCVLCSSSANMPEWRLESQGAGKTRMLQEQARS